MLLLSSSFFLKRKKCLLLVIFLLALILRLYRLNDVPVGFHGDEASKGYNAYSILKTGRDQDGNFLPLAIDQFGDFSPPGYHYLDIPFVAFLGLSEFAVRLPAALFGSLSIFIFYFFLLEFLNDSKTALVGSALLAVSPWHTVISRASDESIVAVFFVLMGLYFYLKALKNNSHLYLFLIISFLSFLLSFLFYHVPRFFVFTFLPPFLFIIFRRIRSKRQTILISSAFYVILLVFLVLITSAGRGASRPFDVSIFNAPGGDNLIARQISEDGTQHPLITRFFHNKLIFYGRLFFQFYLKHFSGEFLFLKNGFPIRYRIPWTGNLYFIECIFLLFGFSVLLVEGIKRGKILYLIPIIWLLLAAVPAGLTWEDIPNVRRASIMIPALLTITAFGIKEIFSATRGYTRIFLLVICGLIFFQNFTYFLHNYFHHSRVDEPWYRSVGEKELVMNTFKLSQKYEKVITTSQHDNNLVFHLFYRKIDPAYFHSLGSPKDKDGLEFQNITFTYAHCPLEGDPENEAVGEENVIYINRGECKIPKNAQKLKTIKRTDGTDAFHILKLKEGPWPKKENEGEI